MVTGTGVVARKVERRGRSMKYFKQRHCGACCGLDVQSGGQGGAQAAAHFLARVGGGAVCEPRAWVKDRLVGGGSATSSVLS